jgi:hypothetical protein
MTILIRFCVSREGRFVSTLCEPPIAPPLAYALQAPSPSFPLV